jgi:hypothetical protein
MTLGCVSSPARSLNVADSPCLSLRFFGREQIREPFVKPTLALAGQGTARERILGISRQDGFGLSGGMTQAAELPVRKCCERDNRRGLIRLNGFSPDQALGREGSYPSHDWWIRILALD